MQVGNKWGFINPSGKVVAPFIYDGVDVLVNGFARVAIGKKAGFINSSGKVVVPIIYHRVDVFSSGFASVVLGNKWDSSTLAARS